MSDTTTARVAASNGAQLAAWDGTEGQYWAAHADRYDASIADYHRALLDLAVLLGHGVAGHRSPPEPEDTARAASSVSREVVAVNR